MVALISVMSLVIGSWFVFFLMFTGFGLVVQRSLKQVPDSGTLWLDAFWLGWSVSLLILQLWNFVFPINDVIFIIMIILASLSLIRHRTYLSAIVRRFKQYRGFLFTFGLALLWLANHAIDMPTAYDTGFRDIQAVMWLDTYPVIPGLNNLFSSLAFNQSVYLYDALLDVSIWSGRAYYVATGLLITVFLARAIYGASQLFHYRQRENVRWSWIVLTLLIPYVLFETVGRGGITHYLTDTAVDLIGFLCVAYVLDFIQYYRIGESSDYLIYRPAILILTGFTLKQSFIVFGLSLGLVVLFVWIRRGGLNGGVGKLLRVGGVVIMYGLLIGLPYMARGVITSGYIAYPQSIGRFDVDWAEAPELVKERQEMLATNTRIRYADPEDVLGSWNWVVPWFQNAIRRLFEFTVPVLLSIMMLLLYVLGRLRSRHESRGLDIGWWIILPMLIMIIVWFWTAPNIKYIKYILWVTVAVLTLLAFLSWHQVSLTWRIYGVFVILSVGLMYVGYSSIAQGTFILPAGPDDGFYVRPTPPIKVVVTQTGAEINTPDSHIKQCWDIPLPCTPVPHTRIYERVPGDIRHGFGLLSKDTDSD